MINGKKSMTQSPLEVLSDRELEIFEMVGRGIKSSEIAERLFISAKTVESYRTRIKDKLNLHSSAELMQHAVQWVESVKM
jgi:DNA-binding CsgD family transcriptional regulator